jgi:DNA polymerase-2
MQTFIQNSLSAGFLLTKQSQDKANAIVITLWLVSKQGPVKLEIYDELALFFVETSQSTLAINMLTEQHLAYEKVTDLPLKTFNQQSASCLYFKTLRDFYAARDALKQMNIKCYEDDFRPDDRYLMERFITAGIQFQGNTHQKKGYLQVNGARCKATKIEQHLSMLSIDLECSMQGELYSIGAYSDNQQKVFMIGDQNAVLTDLPYLEWVTDEKHLLQRFITWLNESDPDIIIGWNVINFDFSLLQKRCDKYNINFAIGRDGQSPYWRKNTTSDQQFIAIAGRVVLDGIDLLKTATYSFPSFSLDNVANTLLGIGKKIDDVDNRGEEITEKFLHNKPALAAYNLEDCRLVWLIFEKTHLLDFAKLRAQLTGLDIDRVGGSVAAFTNLYLPKLHRAGYIAPNMGDGEQGFVSPGGHVMDSLPGLYDNVLVLDFKSLYPSIIRTFNIDPMGLIEGLKAPQEAIKGFDGAYFSRKNHFLPDIIRSLWQERDIAKKDKNAALSQAIKIIMNSFYGVLGSTGCRFFDPRLSGSITKRSHEILKTTKQWIEENKGFTVIYGDTDSIFVHIGKTYNSEQSQILGKELQYYINQQWQQKLQTEFNVTCELDIEFETHFTKFLMPTIRGLDIGTKKRYAGLVVDSSKVAPNNQHIVFKGLESVRTDWTELAKNFQGELYHRVFNDLPVVDYIKDMVAKTYSGEFDHQLIYRKRIRRKLKDYIKNIPPHIKAARNADEINKNNGKPLRYQNKGWIEYYITINGPQTKEHLTSAIDYQFYIERQLEAVADGILPFINTSFAQITDKQMNLFF